MNGAGNISWKNVVAYLLITLALLPGVINSFSRTLNSRHLSKFDSSFERKNIGTFGHGAVIYQLKPKDAKSVADDLKTSPETIENSDFYMVLDQQNRPLKLRIEPSPFAAKVTSEGKREPVAKIESSKPMKMVPAGEIRDVSDFPAVEIIQVEKSNAPLKVDVSPEENEKIPDNFITRIWNVRFLPRTHPAEFYSLTVLFFLAGFWILSLKSKLLYEEPMSHSLSLKSIVNVPLLLVYWFVSVNVLDFVKSPDILIAVGLFGAGLKADDKKLFW